MEKHFQDAYHMNIRKMVVILGTRNTFRKISRLGQVNEGEKVNYEKYERK